MGNQVGQARRVSRTAVALAAALALGATMSPAPALAVEGPVVVSLTFDDGLASQYQLAPTLAAHGVRATFFLNTGLVPANEGAGRMTWAGARALAAAGHEIGGHTLNHVNLSDQTIPLDERRRQVCEDRANLVAHGFSPVTFAYPTGGTDATAEGIVRDCGYRVAREAGGLLETGPNYAESVPPRDGAFAVRALGTTYNGPITLAALQTTAQAARANGGGWLPMLFHAVCYQDNANYSTCMSGYRPVDAAVIDQFLTWVRGQSGISVKPMAEVFNGGVTPPPPADTTAPTVRITSPAGAATVTTSTVTISGTAGTDATDDRTVTVQLFAGSTPVQSKSASVGAAGTWSVVTDTLADGVYTVRAGQRDAAGNTGTSNVVSLTVDTKSPPVISKPELTSLSPAVLGQGAKKVSVKLTGKFDPTSTISFSGKGVHARVLTRSDTSMTLALRVTPSAPLGARDVTVTNADGGRYTCSACFRVAKGPRIKSLAHGRVARGSTTWVSVIGAGFTEETLVAVDGRGVRLQAVRVQGTRRLQVAVTVDPGVRRTTLSVTVTDRQWLGSDTLTRRLRVR